MRKIFALLLCAALLAVMLPTVCALTPTNDEVVFEDSDITDGEASQDEESDDTTKGGNYTQTYELTALADGTVIFTPKAAATFWEAPTLKAGEAPAESGQLIFHNRTSAVQKLGLKTVVLPYDNEESLRYLNHVNLTIQSGDTVLYDGPYSRINDDPTFKLTAELQPGDWVGYTVRLYCDFGYAGQGLAKDETIQWQFYTIAQADNTNKEGFADPALLEVVLACGIALIVLVGIFLYDHFRKRR